jgi:predicted Zn-dependent protease with MMP-like domain
MSSNNDVATVTQFGLVTSRGNGTCTLTATCGNYSASCNVLVNIEESVNTYSITNNLTNVSTNNSTTSIEEGQSYDAILTCGNDYEISSVVVTMNGIDVTNSVYEPEYEESITIPCTSISLNKSIISFNALNTTQTLIATVFPSDTTDTISWSSSATNIAKVNNNGVVTSIGNGSCTITATCGSKSDTCAVNVSVNSGSSDLYTNPIVSFDTDTYRVNLTQDGYSETFYVSYARNEETPGYKGIKQFYDNDSYPYYLTLADQGSSKFRINGNIPVDGYCLYTGGYDGNGYFLDLTTKALQERNLNMQFRVSGLSQELVQDAMNHINNNAKGSAINFNIVESNNAPYVIESVNIEDEVLGYNYTTQGYIQINEWMMNDYFGEFTTNDKRIFRRWRSTLVHELGHCLGFDDEAEHIPTMYNYYRDIEDDEAMCCLQANDWVFLETEFKNKLSFDLRTATTSTIPSYDLPNNELDIDVKKVRFTRPYYKDTDISNKADIILEGYLSYKETKELNVSKNEDKEVLIEYDIFAVTVKEFIKGSAIDIEIKIPKNELSVNEESLYKLYLKQYNNTPCSPINLKQGIKELQ